IMGRAQAAARRAVEIDGDNADGAVVIAVGNGLWFSSYANYDGATARVLAQFADHSLARRTRASFLFETGRVRESVEVGAALVDPHLPLPGSTSQAIRLWAAGRPDEAEALLDTLIGRWPRHYSVWSTRYKFLLFSGKAKKAENMLGDSPVGLEDIDFAIWASQTKAILSGSPDDVTAALRLFDGIAASVMSKAQEAVIFASAVGRVDAAFDYLDLYYFTALGVRSFRKRFPPRQLQPHSGVLTYFLFEPPMRAVREDARFASLVERLGLSSYWRTNRLKPDFAERA
ncbi:MAG: hypothetical protein ACREBO_04635, partial [Novosphingobium sp.]